ncbi:unnamed protein product, partial [Ectocarpus sp. 4 AP-2014]
QRGKNKSFIKSNITASWKSTCNGTWSGQDTASASDDLYYQRGYVPAGNVGELKGSFGPPSSGSFGPPSPDRAQSFSPNNN